jgi:hypothetical protein
MGGSSPMADFRASAARSEAQGVYNLAHMDIHAVNLKMQNDLNQISQNIIRTGATQRAQFASTGLAVGSKSFLTVMSDTTSQFERAADEVRQGAEVERQRIWYVAQLRATQLENRARAAELQGRLQAQQRTMGAVKSVFSTFSRLG